MLKSAARLHGVALGGSVSTEEGGGCMYMCMYMHMDMHMYMYVVHVHVTHVHVLISTCKVRKCEQTAVIFWGPEGSRLDQKAETKSIYNKCFPSKGYCTQTACLSSFVVRCVKPNSPLTTGRAS